MHPTSETLRRPKTATKLSDFLSDHFSSLVFQHFSAAAFLFQGAVAPLHDSAHREASHVLPTRLRDWQDY